MKAAGGDCTLTVPIRSSIKLGVICKPTRMYPKL